MHTYPLYVYFVVALGMFLVGMSKGGLGATLSAVTVPMMALVLPVKDVIGMMPPVLMLADALAVGFHWGKWDGRMVRLLIPSSLIGVTIGTLFLANAPSELIRLVLGIIVIIFVIYKVFERRLFARITYRPHNWHGVLAGSVAGFTSSVAHTGGPPVGMYLLLQGVQPRTYAATSAIFFLILNYIKVPFYYVADVFNFKVLATFLWLLPMVPLGVLAGKWIVVRVSKGFYDNIILFLLFVSAMLLIFSR
ncbi:MAG: sulfite exporter TauE/SafE family protein [Caldilineae bacterium]|nr:MAG: sulfite exporter TauE/SafE family protein [Caldilineae bacterium]